MRVFGTGLAGTSIPPVFPNRPSRGPRTGKPLSPQPNASSAACPDRVLPRYAVLRSALQAAAVHTAQALTLVAGPGSVPRRSRGRRQGSDVGPQRRETEPPHRHAAWGATYEAIHPLHAQGTPVPTRAEQLGISRPTV